MKLNSLFLVLTALISLNSIGAQAGLYINALDLMKVGIEKVSLSPEQICKIAEHIPNFLKEKFSPDNVLEACEKAHQYIPTVLAKDLYAQLIDQAFAHKRAQHLALLYTITGAGLIVGSYVIAQKLINYWHNHTAEKETVK